MISSAIEGNTLSLAETQMVLAYGMTVNGHPLREFLEATNHAQAFDALIRLATNPITGNTVLILHRLVMDKIDPHAGELHTVQGYIRSADFTPPSARDVPLYLEQWVRWLTSDDAMQYEPVTRAAIAHHDFEALHPFPDGNGRVGRLLLNLMLMQEGYPPALVLREWRTRYMQALHTAHLGDDRKSLTRRHKGSTLEASRTFVLIRSTVAWDKRHVQPNSCLTWASETRQEPIRTNRPLSLRRSRS